MKGVLPYVVSESIFLVAPLASGISVSDLTTPAIDPTMLVIDAIPASLPTSPVISGNLLR